MTIIAWEASCYNSYNNLIFKMFVILTRSYNLKLKNSSVLVICVITLLSKFQGIKQFDQTIKFMFIINRSKIVKQFKNACLLRIPRRSKNVFDQETYEI